MFFIVAYAYFFVSVLFDFQKIGNEQLDFDFGYLKTLKVVFILQGVYLPIIRFIEPAFYKVLKENIRQLAFKIIFRPPPPLSDYELICVNSLCNRGLQETGKYTANNQSSVCSSMSSDRTTFIEEKKSPLLARSTDSERKA